MVEDQVSNMEYSEYGMQFPFVSGNSCLETSHKKTATCEVWRTANIHWEHTVNHNLPSKTWRMLAPEDLLETGDRSKHYESIAEKAFDRQDLDV